MGLFDNLFKKNTITEYVKPKQNPLNVFNNRQERKVYPIGDFTEKFEIELLDIYDNCESVQSLQIEEFIEVIVYYTINFLIELKQDYENLPITIVSEIAQQVLVAAQANIYFFNRQEIIKHYFTQVEKKIYEPGIISETKNIMKSLAI